MPSLSAHKLLQSMKCQTTGTSNLLTLSEKRNKALSLSIPDLYLNWNLIYKDHMQCKECGAASQGLTKLQPQNFEFGAFLDPSGQNQLWITYELSKIWDLAQNNFSFGLPLKNCFSRLCYRNLTTTWIWIWCHQLFFGNLFVLSPTSIGFDHFADWKTDSADRAITICWFKVAFILRYFLLTNQLGCYICFWKSSK